MIRGTHHCPSSKLRAAQTIVIHSSSARGQHKGLWSWSPHRYPSSHVKRGTDLCYPLQHPKGCRPKIISLVTHRYVIKLRSGTAIGITSACHRGGRHKDQYHGPHRLSHPIVKADIQCHPPSVSARGAAQRINIIVHPKSLSIPTCEAATSPLLSTQHHRVVGTEV